LRAQIDATIDPSRAIWPLQALFSPLVDAAALSAFAAAYGLSPITVVEAAKQTFQTKEDWEAYLTAPGAVAFTLGKAVLPPAWQNLKSPASDMTHDLRAGEFANERIQLALFSDNGNGLHASRAIAKQIVDLDGDDHGLAQEEGCRYLVACRVWRKAQRDCVAASIGSHVRTRATAIGGVRDRAVIPYQPASRIVFKV